MVNNLVLNIGFKGQLTLNGEVVPLQEGYLELGGFVDTDASDGLKFGVVASSAAGAEHVFSPGKGAGNTVRGICVFDNAVAQNAPTHPDRYLAGLPCAVLTHGFVWIGTWAKDSSAPALDSKVGFNSTTGEVGFYTGTAPVGYEELANAQVRDIDPDKGALVYLD